MPLIKTHPIQTVRDALRQFDYAEAKTILTEEYRRDTRNFEFGRIANLIEVGLIADAIVSFNRLESSLTEYRTNPPADENIGAIVPIAITALSVPAAAERPAD